MMTKLKILVVDDDPIAVKVTVADLQSLGYATESAYRGDEALQILLKAPNNFAAVILDRMMLGMDGLALLKQMKLNAQLQHVPVIMQTGEAEREEIIEAIQAGAAEVMFKPIDTDLLDHVLKRLLKNKNVQ